MISGEDTFVRVSALSCGIGLEDIADFLVSGSESRGIPSFSAASVCSNRLCPSP